MRRLLINVLFFTIFAITNGQNQDLALKDAINQFSSRFYKEIALLNPKENAICSPLSAHIALGFLSVGAQGETQKELNSALYLPDSGAEAFKSTIAGLQDVKGIILNIANKIYIPDGPGYSLAPEFQEKAVEIFNSEVQNINFGESAKAASTINQWVESKTNNKIKDLIKSSDLNGGTNMVLVNAIYFKGTWQTQFNASLTEKKEFNLNSKDKVKVDMMSHKSDYAYIDIPSLDARALEMPYIGKDASMVIILPNEIDGLSKLEEKIATTNLKEAVFDEITTTRPITLSLPKFKIETEMNLNSVLPKLGINLIFDSSKGDLSGILSGNQKITVSKVIQKAFIEINEEGTEAAAATAIIGYGASLPNEFNCNHPFIFVIKKTTGEILFIGRYGTKIAPTAVTEDPKIPEDTLKSSYLRRYYPLWRKLPLMRRYRDWRF
ncbi:antichymotrypsin-2-like [Arctopsyche grandis]|uniref:antichymotrypsin-2-like n=1 Tax=Arctopsyche grandis TaxID=121162 RepID=UPI00406D8813